MKLYHGTSEDKLKFIIDRGDGIKPRKGRKGNWGHTVESNTDCVYLTNGYAIYFAGCAVKGSKQRLAVVELESASLRQELLVPDEDFLEQATRKSGPAPLDRNMKYRTRWYRRRLLNFRYHWLDSIEYMGNCAYHGVVEAKALTRVALLTPETHMRLVMHGMDPIICTLNYQILGAKYRNYCHWLFGDPLEPDPFNELAIGSDQPEMLEHYERHKIENLKRDGVEVKTL